MDTRSRIRITQIKSIVGQKKVRRRTVRALGLKRIGDSIEQEKKPEILGMIYKVQDLVRVEELKD